MRQLLQAAVFFALLTGAAEGASAQIVKIDEGTFDVRIGDRAVGSEAFQIVRQGEGAESYTSAGAQIRLDLPEGSQRMAPFLRTSGLANTMTRYEIKTAGVEEREIYIEQSGERRLHAKVVTAAGEREQELRFQPDLVVLEDRVAHQLYFLGIRIASGSRTVPVLVPAGRDQLTAQISAGVAEGVDIAGTSVSATRYDVAVGDRTLRVWYDEQMRVLRVDNTASGYVAIRRALP